MKVNGTLKFKNLASDPSTPVEGQIYYNSTDKKIKFYDGTSWVDA